MEKSTELQWTQSKGEQPSIRKTKFKSNDHDDYYGADLIWPSGNRTDNKIWKAYECFGGLATKSIKASPLDLRPRQDHMIAISIWIWVCSSDADTVPSGCALLGRLIQITRDRIRQLIQSINRMTHITSGALDTSRDGFLQSSLTTVWTDEGLQVDVKLGMFEWIFGSIQNVIAHHTAGAGIFLCCSLFSCRYAHSHPKEFHPVFSWCCCCCLWRPFDVANRLSRFHAIRTRINWHRSLWYFPKNVFTKFVWAETFFAAFWAWILTHLKAIKLNIQ